MVMNKRKNIRYIGIIGDGATDRDIILKLITCILNANDIQQEHFSYKILQRQKIRDHVEKFWFEASRNNNDYSLSSNHSKTLINSIVSTLWGAFEDFQSFVGRGLSSRDIIIINTDSERKLTNAERYFEEWASSLSKLVIYAIDRFYHYQATRGYSFENSPLIAPIILFPSTDILVVAAKSVDGAYFSGYGMNAGELKMKLYNSKDLRCLTPDEFESKALKFLTREGLYSIYRHLPEARYFIHTISSL